VSTVGILSADSLLRFPDFRAHERAFQLMAQVAGRSGRRDKPGNVIIQAHEARHPVIDLVTRHDVEGFFNREAEHRRAHGYPPFMRLLALSLRHRSEERVAAAAASLALALREQLDERVLGPDIPGVAFVKDRHIRNLLVKLRRSAHHEEKAFVRECIDRVFALPEHRAVQLVADVDPV
jgi:primosomal protein N' (replication factor Y)